MGNTSGIKWNGINNAGTLQSTYEIILRDIKTNNEEKILLPDFFTQVIDLGLIPSGGSGWSLTGNAGTNSATNFIGTTDGENFIIQPDSGSVGIGLTAPLAKLHVQGDGILTTTSDFLDNILISWNATNAQISYVHSDLGTQHGVYIDNTTTTIKGYTSDGSTPSLLIQDVLGAELVRINTDGSVGIGTATPTSKLTVADGDAEIIGSANGIILESPDSTRYRVTVANGGTLVVTAV